MWGKDRYSTVPGRAPANLRAALVNAGYTLPRWPDLRWQDGVMYRLADALESAGCANPMDEAAPDRAALWAAREAIARRVGAETHAAATAKGRVLHARHVAWAIRDGLALAEYRTLNSTSVMDAMFGGDPTTAALAADLDDLSDDDTTDTTEEDERAAVRAKRAAAEKAAARDDDDL
jgi:hypothetical protein